MGRWADIQDGRVDLVASDGEGDRHWSLYRVLLDDDDRSFIVRLSDLKRIRMEIFDNLPDACARCVEWSKS